MFPRLAAGWLVDDAVVASRYCLLPVEGGSRQCVVHLLNLRQLISQLFQRTAGSDFQESFEGLLRWRTCGGGIVLVKPGQSRPMSRGRWRVEYPYAGLWG